MGASLVKCALTPNGAAGWLQGEPVRQAGGSGKGNSNEDRFCCNLCHALGTGHEGHRHEFCYCDPANPMFNKVLLDKCIKFAKAKGI